MGRKSIIDILGEELTNRDNPTDLKTCLIGKVVKLDPITVSIDEGSTLLVENKHLIISEWFKFRKNIDKTSLLSNVPDNLDTAIATAACNASTCSMATALQNVCNEIKNINTELKQLKLDLQLNDLVLIGSLEETDKYILIDKV